MIFLLLAAPFVFIGVGFMIHENRIRRIPEADRSRKQAAFLQESERVGRANHAYGLAALPVLGSLGLIFIVIGVAGFANGATYTGWVCSTVGIAAALLAVVLFFVVRNRRSAGE